MPAGYAGYKGGYAGYNGGYRTRAMLGEFGSPYTANSPWTFEQGHDPADVGEF